MSYATWEKQFDGQVTLFTATTKEVLKDSVQVLENVIRANTPVGNPALWKSIAPPGYVPGTLRASWDTEKHSDYSYTIFNPQPYALRVEEGWSYLQAPDGMMRRATLDWSYIVKKVAKARGL